MNISLEERVDLGIYRILINSLTFYEYISFAYVRQGCLCSLSIREDSCQRYYYLIQCDRINRNASKTMYNIFIY